MKAKAKRKRALCAVLCFGLLTIFCPAIQVSALDAPVGVSAEDGTLSDDYTAEEFGTGEILDALPPELAERFDDPNRLFDPEGLLEETSSDRLLRILWETVRALLPTASRTLSVLLGAVILASALSTVKGLGGGLSGVCDLAVGLVILLLTLETAAELFGTAKSYLDGLTVLMNAILPVMTAISVASGNLTASAVAANAMMLGLALVETLASRGLYPVLKLCFGLTAASGVGGGLKFDGVTKMIRELFTWILGLAAAMISAMMSFQTSIAVRADSLAMRAVKFAASSAVPVVGGIAGDAVRTVAGSLSLIRGTVGGAGVFLVVLLTLPVILEILLSRLGVKLAGLAADVLGLEREKRLLGELVGLLDFLCAVCVIASLMFVYALTLLARVSAQG